MGETNKTMNVAVFGLGYIGTVCGACLAHNGHMVRGVDVQSAKVDLISQGQAPVIEPGLQVMISEVVTSGNFSATADATEAMSKAEAILVCVGTPASDNGEPNLKYLKNVIRQISENLKVASDFPVVVIRSTVPPGTIEWCAEALAESSGRVAGKDFGVVSNPEFLREGSALADFLNPPYTLAGTLHTQAVDIIRKLYHFLEAPLIVTEPGPAELIKYVNNSFHALKIAFANEIGTVCKSLSIDSHQVMDLLCSDTKLNISPAYLKPGFAYGGSCLPKDLEALNMMARQSKLDVPVLNNIAKSNQAHLNKSIRMITATGNKRLGFLGLSFKAHTDDLRESASVKVVEALLDDGYDIRIYDPNVNLSRLLGANRAYIETHVKHLAALLVDSVDDLTAFADTIVISSDDSTYSDIFERTNGDHIIVDLARLPDSPAASGGRYHGICW